jgi:hypothetical protein
VPDDHEKQLSGASWPSSRAEPVSRRRTNGSESARCSTQIKGILVRVLSVTTPAFLGSQLHEFNVDILDRSAKLAAGQ